MRKIFTISKMMLKTNSNPFEGLTNKTNAKPMSLPVKIFLGIVIGFSLIVVMGLFSYLVSSILDFLGNINQPYYAVYLYLIAVAAFCTFFAIILTPSTYYFDETIERYLVLPIKESHYLAAKWIVNAYNISLMAIPFSVLFTIIFAFKVSIAWYTIPFLFIATIVTPLIPISAVVFFTVLLFKAMPFVRNKNVYVYFTSFLALVFGLGFNLLTSTMGDMDNLVEAILSGIKGQNNSLLNVVESAVPSIGMFMEAITKGSILHFLAAIGITALIVVLTIIFTKYNYLKSALSMSETSQSSKKLTTDKFQKKLVQSSKLKSLMLTDFRIIMRTPIYATNYFLPIIIVPVAMAFGLGTAGEDLSALSELPELVKPFIDSIMGPELALGVLSASIILGYIVGSFSTVTSTAISREGTNMQSLILMPVSLLTLIYAKITLGVLTLGIIPLIVIVVLHVLLKLPFIVLLLVLVGTVIGLICGNVISILLDVIKPKLVWNSEQEAVKQNFLSIIPMFLSFGVLFLTVYMQFQNPGLGSALAVAALILVATTITFLFIHKKGIQLLHDAVQSM